MRYHFYKCKFSKYVLTDFLLLVKSKIALRNHSPLSQRPLTQIFASWHVTKRSCMRLYTMDDLAEGSHKGIIKLVLRNFTSRSCRKHDIQIQSNETATWSVYEVKWVLLKTDFLPPKNAGSHMTTSRFNTTCESFEMRYCMTFYLKVHQNYQNSKLKTPKKSAFIK